MGCVHWFSFEWDDQKELQNIFKHGVSFKDASEVFADPSRLIIQDELHSQCELRYFCLGKTSIGILTVRFTYRDQRIRIIGAGFWRKGEKIYEKNKKF